MMSLISPLETSLNYWTSEHGYKQINNKMSCKKHGHSRYYIKIKEVDIDKDVDIHIKLINDAMKTTDVNINVCRGDRDVGLYNHRREGFISFSHDSQTAETFGDLYKVTIDSKIKRIETGVENEILVEPYCYWEYLGDHNVYIHPPNTKLNYKWLGNLNDDDKDIREVKVSRNFVTEATNLLRVLLEDDIPLTLEEFIIISRQKQITQSICIDVWNAKINH